MEEVVAKLCLGGCARVGRGSFFLAAGLVAFLIVGRTEINRRKSQQVSQSDSFLITGKALAVKMLKVVL